MLRQNMKSKGFLLGCVLCALFLLVSWSLQAEASRDIAEGVEAEAAPEVNYYNGGGPYQGGGGRYGGGPYRGGGGQKGGGRGGGYNRGCYHGCCGPRYYKGCRCCASAEEANAYKSAAAKP